MLGREVGIAEGHLEVGVPQDLAKVLEAAPAHDEVRRESVAQVVKAESLVAANAARNRAWWVANTSA